MDIQVPFGYMMDDGKLAPHPIESEVVKYMAERVTTYMENPPDVLVQEVLEEAAAHDEVLTYEEAKSRVSLRAVEALIVDDIYAVPVWRDYLRENYPSDANMIVGSYETSMSKAAPIGSIEPIIDADTWKKAQAVIKASAKQDD